MIMARYRLANDMCSGRRRKYSDNVPVYMRDRPKEMVQKCEVRRVAGSELVDRVRVVGNGKYEVEAESVSGTYTVTLDPSCSCHDYQLHLYPCKHIFAVLSKENKTFMDLPHSYINSPWFALDHHVMSLNPEHVSVSDDVIEDVVEGAEEKSDYHSSGKSLEPLPKKARSQLTIATHCRELLRELTSLTFKVTDDKVLRNFAQTLYDQIQYVSSSVETSEEGFDIEPGTKRSGRYSISKIKPQPRKQTVKSRLTKATECTVDLGLPKRSLPSKWTGRVGISADLRRPTCINTMTRARQILDRAKKNKMTSAHIQTPEIMDSGSEVNTKWSRSNILQASHQLTDDDIDICLQIIHNQWPEVATQPTYHIQRPQKFDTVVKYGFGKYAQVLHMEEAQHWVAVTNVGDHKVRYFDSLGLRLTHNIKCAIASLVSCPSARLSVSMESVQLQKGVQDCGLFAVANLIEVLTDGDPRKVVFDQTKMRPHMVKCVNLGKWRAFPKIQIPTKVQRVTARTVHEQLFCKCRMPYHEVDQQKDPEGGKMIECTTCQEWYHKRCITIRPTDIDPFTRKITDQYLCKNCVDNGKGLV